MYRAFYGLREKPFNLTPDPRFLYLSDKHKEAFAHLLYGIRSRSGFVMVSGEIGTGKTTICRNLLNQLDEDTELAFIFNPMLSPLELLKKIASEFGVDCKGANALELTEELNQYLLEAAAKGKNCVLLIDEAQNLDPQVLEQIRLLSNLETETEKLLQIVLIGQPELGEKLALHELRQLNQRITARYHLKPLSEKEVMQYIAYRLHVAGGRRKITFNRAAVRAVYKISGGTPRVINAVCDRALLIGFTKEIHTITASVVNRAYREIRGDEVFTKGGVKNSVGRYLFHPVTAIALIVLLVIAFLNSPILRQRTTGYLDSLAALLPEVTPPPPKPKPVAPPLAVAVVEPVDARATPTGDPADLPAANPGQPTEGPATSAPTGAPDTLFTATAAEANRAALNTILGAWKKSPEGEVPDTLDPATLENFAQENALSIEFLQPAIDQLLALDLPAIVQLTTDDTKRAVALTAANDEGITLHSGDHTWTMNRSAFRKQYSGDAIVLWQDPAPNAAALLPGSQNANVRRLRTQLAEMGRIPSGGNSDRYDGDLSKAVARIQAETSLDVDGIAGKQVRMVIQSWSKPEGTPGLGTPRKQVPTPQPAPTTIAEAAPVQEAVVPAPTEETPPLLATIDTPASNEATTDPKATPTETPAPPTEAPAPPAGNEVSAEEPPLAQPDTPEVKATENAPEAPDAPAPVTLTNISPDAAATSPDTMPEGTTPEGTTPEGTTPEGTTPEDTTTEDTTTEDTTTEDTTTEDTTPEDTTPEDTTPEDTAPADDTAPAPESSDDATDPTPPAETPAPEASTETEGAASPLGGQLTVVELPDPGAVVPAPAAEENKPTE